jgi:4-amino-4-deoxy-L-arabinose transferase-like glycosyltransferase
MKSLFSSARSAMCSNGWARLFAGILSIALAIYTQWAVVGVRPAIEAALLFSLATIIFLIFYPSIEPKPVLAQPQWLVVGSMVLGFAAIIGFFLIEMMFLPMMPVVITLVCGLVLLVVVWCLTERQTLANTGHDALVWFRRRHWLRQEKHWLLLMADGLLLALAAGIVWSGDWWNTDPRSNIGLALWVAGVALFCFGAWRRFRLGEEKPSDGFRLDGRDWLLIIGVLVVAAGLRFYQLADIPYGSWYDEAESGLEAVEILNGKPFSPAGLLTPFNPSLFFYLIAGAFQVSEVGILPIRLIIAAAGAAAAPLLYLLLRAMFNCRTALIGGSLLAVSAWHINFSRFGLPNGLALPLALLGFFFLVRGYQTRRHRLFLLSGLTLGIGLYSHTAFRLILAVAGMLLLCWLASHRRLLVANWSQLALLAVTVGVISLPLVIYSVQHNEQINRRLSQTWIFAGKDTQQAKIEALEKGLARHALMFNVRGDPNGRHGKPGAPVVDTFTGALLVLGLAYALLHWRRWPCFFLVAWFCLGLSAGALTLDWEAPQAARTVIMIPAVCALAALPLAHIWRSSDLVLPGHMPAIAALAAGGIVCVIGLSNYHRYFNEQMKMNEVWMEFSGPETAEARLINRLGGTYRYYLGHPDSPIIRLITSRMRQPDDYRLFNQYEHLPLRDDPGKDVTFIIEPWRVNPPPAAFIRYYPGAAKSTYNDLRGDVVYHAIIVPYQSILQAQGLRATFHPFSMPTVQRIDATLDMDWSTTGTVLPTPCVAEWSGSLFVSAPGIYTLELETAGEGWLEIGGRRVMVTGAPGPHSTRLFLPKGEHRLAVLDLVKEQKGRTVLSWVLPNGLRQVIPRVLLNNVPLPDQGLKARYYNNAAWQGEPIMVSVDHNIQFRWHPAPLLGDWSVEWRGMLETTVAGVYEFSINTNERGWLSIDGRMALEDAASGAYARVPLTNGLHHIVARYRSTRGYAEMRLFWTPPGQGRQPIPGELLHPED